MIKKLLFLILLSTVCFSNTIELDGLMTPHRMAVTPDYIGISDIQQNRVHIYSLDGKPLTEIGQKGEGPGELHVIESFQIIDHSLVVSDSHKIVIYNIKDLKTFKEIKKSHQIIEVKKCGQHWIGIERMFEGKALFNSINLYDQDFKKIKNFLKAKQPSPMENKMVLVEHCHDVEIDGDTIFIADTSRGFLFVKYSLERSSLSEIIVKDTVQVKMTETFKQETIAALKKNPVIRDNWQMIADKIFFPEHFPHFSRYAVDTRGFILVKTYQQKDRKDVYLLISEYGRLLKKKMLLPSGIGSNQDQQHFAIHDGNIYYLLETDSGNFTLNIESIDPNRARYKYSVGSILMRINLSKALPLLAEAVVLEDPKYSPMANRLIKSFIYEFHKTPPEKLEKWHQKLLDDARKRLKIKN